MHHPNPSTMEAAYTMDAWYNLYQQGHQQEFRLCFSSCYQPLFKYAITIIPDEHQAKQLVGEVIWKAWPYRDRWESLPAFRSFMYTSVKNASINCLHANRRRNKKLAAYLNTQQHGENVDLHASLLRQEALIEIFRLAKTLPKQCRLVFQMHYEEGMDHEQIAGRLELSVSTIRNQKARALRLLKSRIKYSEKI